MSKTDEKIKQFFMAYARRSNDALQEPPKLDVEGTIAAFAPYFVGSSPKGVLGGANDENFSKMIAQGFAGYRKAGGKTMSIEKLELVPLDDFNTMVRTNWNFTYERPKDGRKGNIAFQNLYFVNTAGDTPKIFAYITPDEEAAMKEHGLI